MSSDHEFWPNGARLAVTVSMQFEAGGQPLSGAGGPITEPIMEGYPGLGQNSFYEYGAREEVPRILDLLDRHEIPMTPFMIGDAVRRPGRGRRDRPNRQLRLPGLLPCGLRAATRRRVRPALRGGGHPAPDQWTARTTSRSGPSTTPAPPPGRPGAGSGQRVPGAQPVTRRVVRDLPLDRPPPPGQVSDTR
jgi:peptidoglycan/xylan/chitin deacetylase (PgdA/CDA1 family)